MYMYCKRNQRLLWGMKSHSEALACLVFWQKLLSCRFYSNHDFGVPNRILNMLVVGWHKKLSNCVVQIGNKLVRSH